MTEALCFKREEAVAALRQIHNTFRLFQCGPSGCGYLKKIS